MNVTLYKGCILTERYQEVFDVDSRGQEKTTFERYLDTLDSVTFEIPSAYVQDYGTFNLSYDFIKDGKNYHYLDCNYIRFNMTLGDNSEAVFAFVRNVIKSNTCAIIEYAVDVYHTYMKRCSVRDSLISNFRKKVDNEHAELPLGHMSNKGIKLEPINSNKIDSYYIIARVQAYDTVAGGDTSLRDTGYFLLGLGEPLVINDENEIWGQTPLFSHNKVLEITKGLESSQGNKYVIVWEEKDLGDNHLYYEIDDFMILPSVFKFEDSFDYVDEPIVNNKINVYGFITEPKTGTYVMLNKVRSFDYNGIGLDIADSIYVDYINDSHTLRVKKNTKLYGFGFYTSVIEIPYNNFDTDITFGFYSGEVEFGLYININNRIIEITDLFRFQLPFSGLNAEQTSQRDIARKTGTVKGILSIVNGGAKVFSSFVSAGAAMVTPALTPLQINNLAQQEAQGIQGMVGGLTQIAKGITDIAVANAEKYQSSYGVNANSNAIANARQGISLFFIDSQNELEVTNAINEVGFTVFYKTNSLDYGQWDSTWDYNIVRFLNAKVVGNAPQNILSKLKEILENGVKIWYTKNVS